jgi:hypothetical protein
MEVSVFRGGGLAGLVKKTAVSEESLTADQAAELRAKLDELDVLNQPEQPAPESRQADRFSYAVQVQDDDGEHTVQASEPAVPDSVLELDRYLKTLPGVREEVVRARDMPAR